VSAEAQPHRRCTATACLFRSKFRTVDQKTLEGRETTRRLRTQARRRRVTLKHHHHSSTLATPFTVSLHPLPYSTCESLQQARWTLRTRSARDHPLPCSFVDESYRTRASPPPPHRNALRYISTRSSTSSAASDILYNFYPSTAISETRTLSQTPTQHESSLIDAIRLIRGSDLRQGLEPGGTPTE